MRVDPRLKLIFYISFSTLYISGALEYFTPQALVLRIHGIVGLWFLYFFGHFFKAHIWPSLRQIRHRKTGYFLWGALGALSLSVPFLYYLADDKLRDATVWFHTYLGLFVIVPLAIHIVLAIRDRRKATYRRSP